MNSRKCCSICKIQFQRGICAHHGSIKSIVIHAFFNRISIKCYTLPKIKQTKEKVRKKIYQLMIEKVRILFLSLLEIEKLFFFQQQTKIYIREV